jgi:hypothetical protein
MWVSKSALQSDDYQVIQSSKAPKNGLFVGFQTSLLYEYLDTEKQHQLQSAIFLIAA